MLFSAVKQAPHRPGRAPPSGLRAGEFLRARKKGAGGEGPRDVSLRGSMWGGRSAELETRTTRLPTPHHRPRINPSRFGTQQIDELEDRTLPANLVALTADLEKEAPCPAQVGPPGPAGYR